MAQPNSWLESPFLGAGNEYLAPQVDDVNNPVPSASEGSHGGDDSSSDDDLRMSPAPEPDAPLSLHGIPVGFARNANQRMIVEPLLHCLKERKHILIEHPIEAERREAVIASVVTYFKWSRNLNVILNAASSSAATTGVQCRTPPPSRIFYATQSFEEMKKAVSHLNRMGATDEMQGITMSILGPRRHLCVNGEVVTDTATDTDIDRGCLNRIRVVRDGLEPGCPFYSTQSRPEPEMFQFVQSNLFGTTVRDIEDFVTEGRQSHCPYFDSIRSGNTQLVVCPQEYIFSMERRQNCRLDLTNAILIVDDGYDIEKTCCDEGSMLIMDFELADCATCLTNILEDLEAPAEGIAGGEVLVGGLTQIRDSLTQVADWLRQNVPADRGLPQAEVREMLTTHFHRNLFSFWQQSLQQVIPLSYQGVISVPDTGSLSKIRKLIFVLDYMYGGQPTDYFLNVCFAEPPSGGRPCKTLKIICANASIVFRPVAENIHSVIIAADCLSPILPIRNGLGIEFEEVVQVPENVVGGDRFFFHYCTYGPSGVLLRLNFNDRGDPEVQKEVGLAILQICEKVPNGVIVPFHSYSRRYLYDMVAAWEVADNNGPSIMARLRSVKHVICELDMVNNQSRERLIAEYRERSLGRDGKGALLLCMHRGDIYNKVEFRGHETRAIVHASIPFAPWYDVFDNIEAKRAFFDARHGARSPQNLEWYNHEAFRKLNEMFRISVQDREDWCAVIILDNRMEAKRFQFDTLFPAWARRWVRRGQNHFVDTIRELGDFVANNH